MKTAYSKTSLKYLLAQNKKTRSRIVEHIDKLPGHGDIVKMQGKKIKNIYRLRVGKYRIIYQSEKDYIKILNIDSRGDVYK